MPVRIAMMAVVDFGGSLRIGAKFHGERKFAASGSLGSEEFFVDPNAPSSECARHGGVRGSALSWECRGGLWRAKHAASGPQPGEKPARYPGPENGRALLGGFPLTSENQSELTATIDACNKSNVACMHWMPAD